jgi:guanine deaminase
VPSHLALRGDLLDFTASPAWGEQAPAGLRYRPDHHLLIEQGRITCAVPASQGLGPQWQVCDHRGHLLMPGFIDTHVHSPQLDVIASFGTGLLDWLNTYTFPAERRHADAEVASREAAAFLDALLLHGSTSAVVFPTVHACSTEALFAAAHARGMRLITGKVLMDRHAPEGLRDDVLQAQADCRALIKRWHDVGRLAYAVTVRFAPTSSPEQLAMAGRLCAEHPGLYLQTHWAETQAECAWVRALFPTARSYLDVYAQAGLLHGRSVLAHGIWPEAGDLAVLAQAGACVAHSPSSNLFLGSGLFDWRAMQQAGVAVTVASDVGGGTSLSMQRTLADAYKVQALRGEHLTAWVALHAATRGAAQALSLAHEIGSFDTGCLADVAVWRWACGPVAEHRDALAQQLHERVFAWMTLSDERNLAALYVAGVRR